VATVSGPYIVKADRGAVGIGLVAFTWGMLSGFDSRPAPGGDST
jgi:hypothetical protein